MQYLLWPLPSEMINKQTLLNNFQTDHSVILHYDTLGMCTKSRNLKVGNSKCVCTDLNIEQAYLDEKFLCDSTSQILQMIFHNSCTCGNTPHVLTWPP